MEKSMDHEAGDRDNQTTEMMVCSEDSQKKDDGEIQVRPSWSRSVDFIIACIGGAVGLGNIWRFPFLCYKNGGGAFLIPYFLCMIFGSLPLLIMEVGIGQYMGVGCHNAWGILPLFQGLGLSMVVIIFYVNCYYNVVLAWAFMYFFNSFTSRLPWDSCDNEWNTAQCSMDFINKATNTASNITISNNNVTIMDNNNATIFNNLTGINNDYYNKSATNNGFTDDNMSSPLADPVTEFWERKVLGLSSGVHEIGTPKWDLTLCLLFAWVLVYLCICKGIRSSGKVMYFTAPAPYVFMLIIIIRNATLEGASDGIEFYLKPNLTKLSEYSVWTDAGKQTFFSTCISQGITITLGSYNKFKHNFCRDSIVLAFVNSLTSFFAGFLVFTILGFMAIQHGRPIDDVAESGPGLVFIAFPKAVAQMPLPQFWSVVFFVMIVLIGLDSQFLGVEVVITSFLDHFHAVLRKGYRKEIFTAVMCTIMFLIGLVFVCNGGVYVFQMIDYYCAGNVILLVGFLQVIGISYIYGFRRFCDNISMMVGSKWMRKLYPYLAVCWCFLTPIMCFALFTLSVVNLEVLTYKRPNESVYHYPAWAHGIGWLLSVSTVISIPGVALYLFAKFGFSMKVFRLMLVPFKLKPHQMRPQDKLERRLNELEQETLA